MATKKRKSELNISEDQVARDPEQEIMRANVNRAVKMSPTFVSLYANDVQIQTTPWDVRLILGEIDSIATSNDPTVTIKQVGEVRISPQLAKRLTLILIKQLQGYEKRIGPIPQPQD